MINGYLSVCPVNNKKPHVLHWFLQLPWNSRIRGTCRRLQWQLQSKEREKLWHFSFCVFPLWRFWPRLIVHFSFLGVQTFFSFHVRSNVFLHTPQIITCTKCKKNCQRNMTADTEKSWKLLMCHERWKISLANLDDCIHMHVSLVHYCCGFAIVVSHHSIAYIKRIITQGHKVTVPESILVLTTVHWLFT